MLFEIELGKIEIHAKHGVYEEEQAEGNRYEVCIKLEADVLKAAKSDELSDTVDYQRAYELVLARFEEGGRLLETLCYDIARLLLQDFAEIKQVDIQVKKLKPAYMLDCGYSSVRLQLHRNSAL